ncbi:MAG: flagellar biosynthesis protein FlhB [Armatimonadota bacterium]
MAGEERTEQASPRKREDARKKGQVAKSLEVNSALVLLVMILTVKALGSGLTSRWQLLAVDHLQRAGHFEMTIRSLQYEFMTAGTGFLQLVLPLLCVSIVVGVAANLLQVGFVFAPNSLMPDFSRLNPLQGIARMFSMRSLVELLKSAGKAMLIGYMIYSFFRSRSGEIVQLVSVPPDQLGPIIAGLCWDLLLKTTGVLVTIAVGDYIFQRWQFEKQLRMTKQEVKEEYKHTEGDPMIKMRIRQRQREISRNRMMSDVTTATVVVTNPTHLAVAIRYEPGDMLAPVIVAKGQRLIAQRIKEMARNAGIPVVENKPLARTLFRDCGVGDQIPVELYQAVAEIIAFVFKQSGRTSN